MDPLGRVIGKAQHSASAPLVRGVLGLGLACRGRWPGSRCEILGRINPTRCRRDSGHTPEGSRFETQSRSGLWRKRSPTSLPPIFATEKARSLVLDAAWVEHRTILVNTQGDPAPPGNVDRLDREGFSNQGRLDAKTCSAPIAMIKAAECPAMMDRGWGRVVTLLAIRTVRQIGCSGAQQPLPVPV